MTDRDLATQADAAFRATTTTYATWQKNVKAGKYPAFGPPSQFGIGFGLLAQIGVPPVAVFGTAIPAPPPRPTTTPRRVRTRDEFISAMGSPGVIAIDGRVTLTGETRMTTPGVAIIPYNGYRKDALMCDFNSQIASLKILTNHIWIHDLELGGGYHDGIKLADGGASANVDIKGNWIHDVGDQGVLTAGSGTTDLWVHENRIERVGLTQNPGVQADGHGVYLGGPTQRAYVYSNDIRPRAFGVQEYPGPTDVLVSGNTITGGAPLADGGRGGICVYGTTKNARHIGNMIVDAPSAAFEVTTTTSNSADGNVALRCPMWASGYKQLPGSNLQTASAQAAADYRLAEDLWALLPAVLADGSKRLVANAGAFAA